jgi:tetratricopeptide (TPR) repeat protein/CheY-like chemotaxis protein
LETHDRTIRTVETTLAVIGYEVVVCGGDRDQLKLSLRASPPDLILISADLNSGSGLDILVDRYGDCPRPVPVIAWSGYHKRGALKEIAPVELLLSAVMTAPLDPGELVRLVTMLVPAPDPGAAIRVVADLADDSVVSRIRLEEPRGDKKLVRASLPRMLCAVDFHDWSGCLQIETAAWGAALFFKMGQLVLATTDTGKDLIRTALDHGRIEASKIPDVPLHSVEDEIGLLLALRGIGMHETEWIVAQTAIRILGQCIDAWDGVVKAIPGLEPPGEGYAEPMPVVPILIHTVGAKRRTSQPGAETHPDSILVVRLPEEDAIRSWALTGTAAEVVDQLHKARGREISFRQLVRVVSRGDETRARLVEAVVGLLERIGYVHFSGPPWGEVTAAKLEELVAELHAVNGADLFEVLGVPRTADDTQVASALRTKSLKYHPDRMFDAHPRVQETAAALYGRIQQAYEVLSRPGQREAYRAQLESDVDSADTELAKVALARGKIRMRHKRYEDAVNDFREATLQSPDLAEPRVMLAWARFRVEPAEIKRAMAELSKIVRSDDKVPDAWFYLGRLAILNKELARARKYFDKALRVDPKHVEAQREIRLMDRRGQAMGTSRRPRAQPLDHEDELSAILSQVAQDDEATVEQEPKKRGLFSRLRGRRL